MLHLLSQLPLQAEVFARMAPGDDIVLLDATVCGALRGHQDNRLLQQVMARACQVYAMRDMVEAYGLQAGRLLPGVEPIDYAGLVELTVKHPVIHSWC
ncbi:sulfurtransferase complex subunit TusB [Methylomonas sp. HW2-6]|uniref:sulfurtransferase complex subunit TusB n=1 Tax=Methylomonas sp. HW2-6 TaxID=3376687 RepID=UPI0040432B12